MNRPFRAVLLSAALFFLLPISAGASELLIPVGSLIGLQLLDDTVTVAAFEEEGPSSAKEAGLRIGDEIVSIDGISIDCVEDVRTALQGSGDRIRMTVRRGSKTSSLCFSPDRADSGPKLGVYLRQGISGIGTVTYYDPGTGFFGTLGHGVNAAKGTLLPMKQGFAYEAVITSISRGKSGQPGQLKGSADTGDVYGTVLKNTPCGVFGTSTRGWEGTPMPTAEFEEITTGGATIRSTVSGTDTREYSVEIVKIYATDSRTGRNMLIRITDPALLRTTGGIVQGMSGSPIIQNGKLVGAVTHVLVNDPTTGYGIFIENMLDAAS